MRFVVCALFAALLALAPTAALAKHPRPQPTPHFTNVSITTSGSTISATGGLAGLDDDLSTVHVALTATATCSGPGHSHQQTETVTAAGDFPADDGNATFALSVTAVFGKHCQDVTFSNAVVTDTTDGISFP